MFLGIEEMWSGRVGLPARSGNSPCERARYKRAQGTQWKCGVMEQLRKECQYITLVVACSLIGGIVGLLGADNLAEFLPEGRHCTQCHIHQQFAIRQLSQFRSHIAQIRSSRAASSSCTMACRIAADERACPAAPLPSMPLTGKLVAGDGASWTTAEAKTESTSIATQ